MTSGALAYSVVDRVEACGLAFGVLDHLVLVGGGAFANLRGLAAGVAELRVGVLARLFLESRLVLLGALHFVERIGDFGRRRHVGKLAPR